MLWATKITFHVKTFYATHAQVTHVNCFFSVYSPLSLLKIHFSSFFLVFSCIAYYTFSRVRGTYPLSHKYKKILLKSSARNSHILHRPFFPPLLLLYIHFSCFFLVLSCTAYYTLPRVRGTYHLSHILGDGHRRRHAPACPRSHSRPPPARLPTPGPAPSFCRTFIFKDPSRGRNVQSETRMDFLAQCNSWAHILDLNKPMSMNFRELTAIEVHTLILKRPHTSTHAYTLHNHIPHA
jgi:hypothetical protein